MIYELLVIKVSIEDKEKKKKKKEYRSNFSPRSKFEYRVKPLSLLEQWSRKSSESALYPVEYEF